MKFESVFRCGVQSVRYFLFACAFIASFVNGHADQVSTIGHDEEIMFFPAFAVSIKDTDIWEAEVQGCVYEPEKRQLAIASLHRAIEGNGFKMTASQELVFKERLPSFHDGPRARRECCRSLREECLFVGQISG